MTDEPSWRTFSTTAGADADRTFEGVVCRRIFASEIGVPSSALVAPPGLKGIEVSPVHRNSDWISYQAKYTNTKGVPWQAFRHSVETAVAALRSGYYQLDCVYCYTNAIPGAGKGGARTKQQYQLDNLAETNGLKLVWRFGNQVLDAVRDLPVLGRYFSQDLSHLCDWQEWASSPTPDFLEAAPRFVGRRDELTQLRAFLEDDRPFTWWSLLGSGGSGKTRLVLELAEQVDPSWSVVWLMPHANAVLNNSQITGPTLVVIDGPLQFENGTLEGVVEKFSMREPPKKLRLIFLDRDERPWKRTLLAGEASRSRDTQYDEPLRLGRLDPDAWVDLVEQAAASAQIDRSELEARLGSAAMGEPEPAEGHGSSTPLEVLLAAHVGGAQLDESIRRYLDGKKKDYYPTATTELLALASAITVSGGLHAIDLPDRFKRVLEDPSDRSILSRVMGNGTDPVTNFIAPLRPDPIGEFFVLDHWESRGLLRVPDDLVTALGISSPWKVAEFFNRAAADFPAHEALRVLSHDPPADHDRTWALARMACAHRVLRHSRSLGIELHNQIASAGHRDLSLLSLINLLAADDQRPQPSPAETANLQHLASSHDPLPIALPGQSVSQLNDRAYLDTEYLDWFTERLAAVDPQGELQPVGLIVRHLHDAVVIGAVEREPQRYGQSAKRLAMYAEACTEGGRTPTSTAIEAALRDGIAAWSQFNDRVDPAPYLESLDSMYSAIVRLPEVGPETVDQTRVVMVLAHRGDEDAKALVAELHSRAASSRKRETCQYLTMALTNYTVDVRTKEHFVRAGELVIEAGDLVQDVEVCDYLLQATTNLLRMDGDRVDPNVKEALFKTAVEILLDKGGANRGSTGIVDVIGVRLTQQIQQGQLAEAAESAKTLEAAAARRELSDSVDLTVRTVATGTLSRASLDMISLHRVLELLEPFLPRIDAQTAWTIGSAWFSLIQQGEDKKGELRDALRRLARDHTDLQVLADHVQ